MTTTPPPPVVALAAAEPASTRWDPAAWPRQGRCGACGRPAEEIPSGKWWHTRRPCRARAQSIWRVDDVGIKLAVQFVPAGEQMPDEPTKWHLHPETTDERGIPTSFGVCNTDHTHTVREFLAREAEEANR